jgi:hypothetical protein
VKIVDVDVEEITETGLESRDSITGSLSTSVTSMGGRSFGVGFADEDNASFWIRAWRLAVAPPLVLRLLFALPLLDGGLDSGWESKIWTCRSERC